MYTKHSPGHSSKQLSLVGMFLAPPSHQASFVSSSILPIRRKSTRSHCAQQLSPIPKSQQCRLREGSNLELSISMRYKDCPDKVSDLYSSIERDMTNLEWISDAVAAHNSTPPPNAHSHFALRNPKQTFFEGWYLRLTLPNSDVSYAFIVAIEAPGIGCIQIVDDCGNVHYAQLGPKSKFQASKHDWSLSHWGYRYSNTEKPHDSPDQSIMQGWQMDSSCCHGRVYGERQTIQWAFDYKPTLSWGTRGHGRHTGTWLASMPIFEPGYQVLMAHGVVSNGYITIGDKTVDVTGSVVYAEKNWGRSFPPKWFWVQANCFWEVGDLSVLAVGAVRNVIAFDEEVGMICIHYKGEMYEFANWNSLSVQWDVQWGEWHATSVSRNGFRVEVHGNTEDQGIPILGPTNNGMAYTMRDTMCGHLQVKLFDPHGNVIVDAECDNAQLEVGGEPWQEGKWCASVPPLPQPLRAIVNLFNGANVNTSS